MFHRFVICNEGYTIQRLIHGLDAVYNDIRPWYFRGLVNVFGAKQSEYRTYQIKTKEQTNKLFEDKKFNSANVLQFVKLYVLKKEAPRALKLTAEANNAKQGMVGSEIWSKEIFLGQVIGRYYIDLKILKTQSSNKLKPCITISGCSASSRNTGAFDWARKKSSLRPHYLCNPVRINFTDS
jgi:hypothetical protein